MLAICKGVAYLVELGDLIELADAISPVPYGSVKEGSRLDFRSSAIASQG
jgi:hypothetical protein